MQSDQWRVWLRPWRMQVRPRSSLLAGAGWRMIHLLWKLLKHDKKHKSIYAIGKWTQTNQFIKRNVLKSTKAHFTDAFPFGRFLTFCSTLIFCSQLLSVIKQPCVNVNLRRLTIKLMQLRRIFGSNGKLKWACLHTLAVGVFPRVSIKRSSALHVSALNSASGSAGQETMTAETEGEGSL